jgi:MFS family permease
MSAETQAFGLTELRQILTNGSILLLGVIGMSYSAVQLSVSTYLVLFLKEDLLFPVVIAGTYLMVVSLSGAAGRVLWGVISDRFLHGKRKVVLCIIGLISAIMAISITFLAASVPGWMLYIMMAIFGFASFGWTAVLITFFAELVSREQAGTAVGFGMAVCGSGILFGPPLFGYIVDVSQSYNILYRSESIAPAAFSLILAHIRWADPSLFSPGSQLSG